MPYSRAACNLFSKQILCQFTVDPASERRLKVVPAFNIKSLSQAVSGTMIFTKAVLAIGNMIGPASHDTLPAFLRQFEPGLGQSADDQACRQEMLEIVDLKTGRDFPGRKHH